MSSMARDLNYRRRHARYHAPRVPRHKAARIKAGRVVIVLTVLMLAGITAAYGGGRTGTEQVTVQPGQTVWSIAADRYPDDDTRGMVGEILRLNHLDGQGVYAGEKLLVPAQ